MYLKQIVVACLATALAGGAMAQQLTLKSGYPESYVVQKGDTLWDISGQYLAEPWLWPRLWNINPQIANPHWIYPGDVLHLSWVNGEPRLGKASQGGKQVIRLSPKNRYENKANPIPRPMWSRREIPSGISRVSISPNPGSGRASGTSIPRLPIHTGFTPVTCCI